MNTKDRNKIYIIESGHPIIGKIEAWLSDHHTLDAGEYFDKFYPQKRYMQKIEWDRLDVLIFAESFAQASITAKEKEWEEEKAELMKQLESRDIDVEALNQRIEWKNEKIKALENLITGT